MAASDKVKNSDLFDDNLFQPPIDKAKELLGLLNQMDSAIKKRAEGAQQVLFETPPDSLENLKKINDSIEEINDSEKALGATQKEKLRLEQKLVSLTGQQAIETQKLKERIIEQNKANKQAARDALGLTTEYQKQSRVLNELRNSYKDLSLKGRENGVVGRGLAQTIKEQDTKLKALDASVGQYQRNVGNYSNAFKQFGKNLKGVGGLVGSIANAFGFNSEQIEGIIEKIEKFSKVFKEANKVAEHSKKLSQASAIVKGEEVAMIEAEAIATTQVAVATEAEAVATVEATVAQEGLNAAMKANPILFIVGLIIALGAALYALNAYLTSSSEETKILERENKKLHKTLEEQIRINENRVTVMDAELNLMKAQGKPLEEIRKKTKEINDLKMQSIDDNIAIIQSDIRLNESKLQDIKTNDSLFESILKGVEATQRFLGEDMKADQTAALIAKNRKERSEEVETAIKDQQKALADAQAEKLNLQAEQIEADAEFDAESQSNHEKEMDRIKKLKDARIAAYNAEREARIQAEKDLLAFQDKVRAFEAGISEEEKTKEQEEQERYQGQLQTLENLKTVAQEKGVFDEQRYNQDLEAIEQEHMDQLLSIGQQQNDDQITLIEADRAARLQAMKDEIAARKEAIEEMIAMEEQLADAVDEGLKRRFDARADGLKSEASDIDKQLAINQDAFNRGQANQLAFQEAEKAKNIEKQLELDEQRRKAEEAQQLAGVFLELLKGYAKDGSIDAPAKALAQTLVAKGIADAIAGSAYDGTEDTGGPGNMDSKGGKLWMLHPHEGVATADANKTNPGLIGAMNDGTVDEYFRNIYMPQWAASIGPEDGPSSTPVNGDMLLLQMLSGRLNSLERTVRNKKELDIHWDTHGNLVKNAVEDGIRKITIQQRPF